ncbi:MAG TPA: hypothetical protein VGA13_02405 [Acidimicrobiales bacterium]
MKERITLNGAGLPAAGNELVSSGGSERDSKGGGVARDAVSSAGCLDLGHVEGEEVVLRVVM